MRDKPEIITLKETAKYLYIDSGNTPNFELTEIDKQRLILARDWINQLLSDQAYRENGEAA